MDLRSLEAFCLVARLGTLARAASQMKVSPAAVSLQIKKLEAELAIKLFDHREKEKISLIYRQAASFAPIHRALIGTLIRYARRKA